MCVIWQGRGEVRGAAQNKTWRTRVFCASVGCSLAGFPGMAFSFLHLSNCFYLCKGSRWKALPGGSGTSVFPLGICCAHLCEMAQRSHLLDCLQYPEWGSCAYMAVTIRIRKGEERDLYFCRPKAFSDLGSETENIFFVRLELWKFVQAQRQRRLNSPHLWTCPN